MSNSSDRRGYSWHYLLSCCALIIGVAAGVRCAGNAAEDKLDAQAQALTEAFEAREASVQAQKKMEADFSQCRMSLAEEKNLVKDLEVMYEKCTKRQARDCKGTPLPDRLWPLHAKCVKVWEACDWQKGRETTERGVENACTLEVQECRALLGAAQPGVRSSW